MADTPRVGTRLINDHGTVVKIVKAVEGDEPKPGTVPADRVDDFLDAGYRVLTADDVVPPQTHYGLVDDGE
jgi:hypothetical protein